MGPRSVRAIALLATLATLATLAALAPAPAAAQAQARSIKIATQSPLSGSLAALGDGIRLGAELAVEKWKGPLEKAGFKVELAPFDDQARPDVGVANAKAIVADPAILLVIGHLNSGVAIPSSEIYKEVGLALVSPANTNPLVTDRGLPNVNRVCGREDVQGAVAAEFAADGLKARSVYVVHDRKEYGQSIAELFRDRARDRKLVVHGFEGVEEPAGFGPVLAALKAKAPDVIFFGGEYPQAVALFRQAREQGSRAKLIGPDGLDSPDLLRLGADAVIGMYYTALARPVKGYPKAREFEAEFARKFGKDPEPFAAQAYDATAVGLKGLEAAIREGGGRLPTRAAVARAVRKVKHAGITANVEFDDRGDLRKATYFVIQVAGKWEDNRIVRRVEMAPPAPRKP
jgi:branched-chain amino acid transport system substrate-binding protein